MKNRSCTKERTDANTPSIVSLYSVFARSAATKQSRIYDEIAALPLVARGHRSPATTAQHNFLRSYEILIRLHFFVFFVTFVVERARVRSAAI